MLTINDLSISNELDRATMAAVRGGMTLAAFPRPFFGVISAPIIDVGHHELEQVQGAVINQSGSLGGANAVDSWQTQNGVAGQVVG